MTNACFTVELLKNQREVKTTVIENDEDDAKTSTDVSDDRSINTVFEYDVESNKLPGKIGMLSLKVISLINNKKQKNL